MITSEVIPGKNLLWLQRNEEMRDWWGVAEKFSVGASRADKWRAATFPTTGLPGVTKVTRSLLLVPGAVSSLCAASGWTKDCRGRDFLPTFFCLCTFWNLRS